jgi:hypothetical protein
MRMRETIVAGCLAVGLASGLCAAQASDAGASVAGQVIDGSGNPVAGITVMVTQTAVDAAHPYHGVTLAATDEQGKFTATGLPAGEYNLCASDDKGRYLNPCSWAAPVRVTVAAGQSQTGVQVQVEDAAEVDIDVNDPAQLLASRAGQHPAHGVVVGIGAPRIFVPAAAGVEVGGVKHFKAYAPYDKDLNVYVGGPGLNIVDQANRPLANGNTIPIRISRGQGPKTITVTVAGTAAGN